MSTTLERTRAFPTASPDGLVAAILLSFLATAGLFYVNVMPALVTGLVHGLHFSEKQAGFVASANVYGASLGALIAVFFVRRISWRPFAIMFLCGLIVVDLISTAVTSAPDLIALRFAHGTIGGMLVGTGFSVIARTRVPDRTFGMLLAVQFGLGGVGVMFLPRLVPFYGAKVLFLAFVLFSLVTLAMLPFIADYPVPAATSAKDTRPSRIRWLPLISALAAIILYQIGNMALGAYILELGRAYGLNGDFTSTAVGVANWIGALGSLAVVFLGTRFGRFKPLLVGMVLTVIGNAAFHFSASPTIYAAANVGTAITWAFVISYLLGMSAAFDAGGQTAAMGGFVSKIGLATGPLMAGFLISGNHYGLLIDVSVAALAASTLAALIPAAILDRTPSAV